MTSQWGERWLHGVNRRAQDPDGHIHWGPGEGGGKSEQLGVPIIGSMGTIRRTPKKKEWDVVCSPRVWFCRNSCKWVLVCNPDFKR